MTVKIVDDDWRTETGQVWRMTRVDVPRCAAQTQAGPQCRRVRDGGEAGCWLKRRGKPDVWICTQHADAGNERNVGTR